MIATRLFATWNCVLAAVATEPWLDGRAQNDQSNTRNTGTAGVYSAPLLDG